MCRLALLTCALTVTCQLAFADQTQPNEPFVFGYANQQSYLPGEEVAFHISSSATRVRIVIERQGGTDETVFDKRDVPCTAHPIPDRASSHGCDWPATFSLKIPVEWKSGCYIATLVMKQEGKEFRGQVLFVVRSAEPGKNTRILLQLATNTYNAYTNWGGHSLYSYHDRDGLQGHRVSFNRPMRSQYSNWELPFVRWAENNGYTLDYAVNSNLEFHPEILKLYRLVLSVGHDEYWSAQMRDHLEKYIANGGNVAFFSGNTCCWQVRSEDDGRALTCWKQWYNVDPLYRQGDHKLLSTLWSHHLVERPENELTGVGFLWGGYHSSHGQFMDGPASFKVHRPDHWLFKGTKLKRDERFGGEDTIVGYECDGCEMTWRDGLPFPTCKDGTPESFTILATCPARWAPGDSYWYDRFPKDRTGAAVFGVYTQGGTVVTTGTTDWAHGLRGKDPAVTQITRNILDRLSKREETQSKSPDWISLFNSEDLTGWHKQKIRGQHGTGGNWGVTKDGILFGEQDPPGSGNGGLLLSDEVFSEFELELALRPDWGPDSGIFVRTDEKGGGWQVYVDHHDNGNVGHIRLETKPYSVPFRPFGFSRIDPRQPALKMIDDARTKNWPKGVYEQSCTREEWLAVWNPDDWNQLRIRVSGGHLPIIEVWVNDLAVCQFDAAKSTHPQFDPDRAQEVVLPTGSIGFQVHGGRNWKAGQRVFWKDVRVRRLK